MRNKDGASRFFMDCMYLNNVTKVDVYLFICLDDTFYQVEEVEYLQTLLLFRYWQAAMDLEYVKKTVVITPDELFQIARIPFCLCNAPATFESQMDIELSFEVGNGACTSVQRDRLC